MPEDEVLSALSVVYGFFLLFLSTLLAGLEWIPGALSDYGQQFTYVVVWAASAGSMLLGYELWKRLRSKGLTKIGDAAMFVLTSVLPFFFLLVVGDFVLQSEFDSLRKTGVVVWLVAAAAVFLISALSNDGSDDN